jgi:hypothetical protein
MMGADKRLRCGCEMFRSQCPDGSMDIHCAGHRSALAMEDATRLLREWLDGKGGA